MAQGAFQVAFGKRSDCRQLPHVPVLSFSKGLKPLDRLGFPPHCREEQAHRVAACLLTGQWVRFFLFLSSC